MISRAVILWVSGYPVILKGAECLLTPVVLTRGGRHHRADFWSIVLARCNSNHYKHTNRLDSPVVIVSLRFPPGFSVKGRAVAGG